MNTATALVRSGHDVVDVGTGEVISPRVDMVAYLSRLSGTAAIQEQKQLAAAYDTACAALIGPNDVQVEGGRSFKKKSAWRKLQRHFGISTAVTNVSDKVTEGAFVALVTVRASAPWGQYAEAVGACGTDEATGRRTITIADAIATAETRATNRAVSNLVAMGEVSAEEMSKGNPTPAARSAGSAPAATASATRTPNSGTTSGAVMPFGKTKGTPLADLKDEEIQSAMEWAASKGKFVEFQEAAQKELRSREGVAPHVHSSDDFVESLEDGDEQPLPF